MVYLHRILEWDCRDDCREFILSVFLILYNLNNYHSLPNQLKTPEKDFFQRKRYNLPWNCHLTSFSSSLQSHFVFYLSIYLSIPKSNLYWVWLFIYLFLDPIYIEFGYYLFIYLFLDPIYIEFGYYLFIYLFLDPSYIEFGYYLFIYLFLDPIYIEFGRPVTWNCPLEKQLHKLQPTVVKSGKEIYFRNNKALICQAGCNYTRA